MRNHLNKTLLALMCVSLLFMPVSGQKGKGGGGADSSCAVVTTPLLSTATASAGMNVGVFTRVGNCSAGKKRYLVTLSAVSSCGEETVFASSIVSFGGGQHKLISATYQIAPDTCLGASTVKAGVYSGDSLLASDWTFLTIQ